MPKLLYVRDPNQRATVDERGTIPRATVMSEPGLCLAAVEERGTSPRATLKFELSLFLAQGRASPTEKPTLRSC